MKDKEKNEETVHKGIVFKGIVSRSQTSQAKTARMKKTMMIKENQGNENKVKVVSIMQGKKENKNQKHNMIGLKIFKNRALKTSMQVRKPLEQKQIVLNFERHEEKSGEVIRSFQTSRKEKPRILGKGEKQKNSKNRYYNKKDIQNSEKSPEKKKDGTINLYDLADHHKSNCKNNNETNPKNRQHNHHSLQKYLPSFDNFVNRLNKFWQFQSLRKNNYSLRNKTICASKNRRCLTNPCEVDFLQLNFHEKFQISGEKAPIQEVMDHFRVQTASQTYRSKKSPKGQPFKKKILFHFSLQDEKD